MAESKESELEREERVIAAVITSRRSPRLAAMQQKLNFHESTISSPLKECLRKKIGTVSILDETKQFVAGKYNSLDAQIVTAAVEAEVEASILKQPFLQKVWLSHFKNSIICQRDVADIKSH